MKRILLIIFYNSISLLLSAQNITGIVINQQGEALIGANVYWVNSTGGVVTDTNGVFKIASNGKRLVASYVGYQNDTITISESQQITFRLIDTKVLEEVVVTDRKTGIAVSNLNLIKTENINSTELKKAACCDLAGCFETQSSVEAQVTNVITNAKELRISGLSGVYNQVLIDGFPMIQGLSYTYGLTSIPGTSVANIYVAKGANSVLQGYESISGQINVITKAPDLKKPFSFNVYSNSLGEKQLNVDVSFKVGAWKNLLTVHGTLPAHQQDKDADRFLDFPQLNRFIISDKWKLGKDAEWGWNSEISLRYLQEERTGGQLDFDNKLDLGSTQVYGQNVQLAQPELTAKTTFRWDDFHSLTWFASSLHQQQNSWFGTVRYDAKQTNLYQNLQYQYNYGAETQNSVKTGISFRYLDMAETIGFSDNALQRSYAGTYKRKENVFGFFVENALVFGKFNWLLGIRGDQHDNFGFRLTPRTLLKYEINPALVIRGNIGTGWRTVNLFSENINLLVSSRAIILAETLRPERATNAGVNLTQQIDRPVISGYFSIDFYHTNFQNQIFPDYDSAPTKAIIKNFEGTSISNSFQAEGGWRIAKIIDFKLGYTFTDVYRKDEEGVKNQLPFNARHKFLGVLSYRPLSNKFQWDVNAHWWGKQRLPNTATNPVELQRPDFSETYGLINTQFTYNFSDNFSVYTGCENIFDFRQEQPIISWQNPFGRYFDTSFIWGPTQGRMFYLGVRYHLDQSKG